MRENRNNGQPPTTVLVVDDDLAVRNSLKFSLELEGFAVLWHLASYETVGVSTMQSRACAGIAGGTVVYALPGSNGACRDGWDRLICPQLDSRHRPCSIVEVIPRFQET